MDTLETRMTALAAADAAAANDPLFTHKVMAAIAQRRARLTLVLDGALVLGGSLALAVATPFLGRMSQGAVNAHGLMALAIMVTAVGLAPAWWLLRRQ